MKTILGLDASGWQGEITQSQFEQAKAKGFEFYVAQLWGSQPRTGQGINRSAQAQLANARAAGYLTMGYIWIPPDTTTKTRSLVQASLDAAGSELPYLLWIAPDLEGRQLHPTNSAARLQDLIDNINDLSGKPTPIYCRANNWHVVMGGPHPEFAENGLWEARYLYSSGTAPNQPPALDWRWTPFGGWNQRHMLQYAGTADTGAGFAADFNIADAAWLIPDSPPELPPLDPTPSNPFYERHPVAGRQPLTWDMREVKGLTVDVNVDRPSVIQVNGYLGVYNTYAVSNAGCWVETLLNGRRFNRGWVNGENVSKQRHYANLPLFGRALVQPGTHRISVRARCASSLALKALGLIAVKDPQYSVLVVEVIPA